MHTSVRWQDNDSGVSIAYKGCGAQCCHELEIAFSNGNAISLWGTSLDRIEDVLKLALKKVQEAKAAAVVDA